VTDYHRDGNCHPDHCKECDWALANMREDHERNVCDGYPRCLFVRAGAQLRHHD